MNTSLMRSALELRSPMTRLPPTFLLPIRARWVSSTAQASAPSSSSSSSSSATTSAASLEHLPPWLQRVAVARRPSLKAKAALAAALAGTPQHSTSNSTTTITTSPKKPSPPSSATATAAAAAAAPLTTPAPSNPTRSTARTAPSAPATAPPTGPLPEAVKHLLPLLRAQPTHYITIHIHGRPYLVTPGDTVRLPFLMPGVVPGDVLRLNRASVLGSRDYTLRPSDCALAGQRGRHRPGGAPNVATIDERLYECRATVVGVEAEPLRSKEKTKRRNRRVRTIKSKHRYTVLRITDLKIKSPEEIEG